MKKVHVTQSVGMVLGHDLTRIVPGEFKGAAFKKGHVIKDEDLPMLLSMGKDHICILELKDGDVHENEAASLLAQAVAGLNLNLEDACEGKVNIRSAALGLLKVNKDVLMKINVIEGIALSTIHGDNVVKPGQLVASAKIVPMVLPQSSIDKVGRLAANKAVLSVLPLPARKAGVIITGNEVYYGRIEDKFQEVIARKLNELGSNINSCVTLPDDADKIARGIEDMAAHNDIVFVTGGMSVDPDDVTPLALRSTGAKVVAYGTPVLPGAMFMVAYLSGTPVLGIPACGMFNKVTALDVILPKVLAGEIITREYIASLGYGGLCQSCAEGCRFPNCPFCK